MPSTLAVVVWTGVGVAVAFAAIYGSIYAFDFWLGRFGRRGCGLALLGVAIVVIVLAAIFIWVLLHSSWDYGDPTILD
jgi:hypothetical protein